MADAFNFICAECGSAFTAAHSGARTCSNACRVRLYRARLLEQRARLGAEADAALRSGDVAALEAVARRAAAMLHP